MAATEQSNSEAWNWRTCFLAGIELWERDKVLVVMFVVVNLMLGQIGVIASLIFAADSAIATVWGVLKSNFSAAALYTFSITLLTGTLAGLAIEIIDKSRKTEIIIDFEYKMFWFFIALLLIVLQSTVAGNLIASTSLPTHTISSNTPLIREDLKIPVTSMQDGTDANPDSRSPISTVTSDAPSRSTGVTVESFVLQSFFWLLSMITAFVLFSLQRRELAPTSYVKTKKREVDDFAEQAKKADSTSFGEAI